LTGPIRTIIRKQSLRHRHRWFRPDGIPFDTSPLPARPGRVLRFLFRSGSSGRTDFRPPVSGRVFI